MITQGFSESTSLDPRVVTEIERVLPEGGIVFILGGDLALSSNIDVTLTGLGYGIVREAGANEYATAVDIAEMIANSGWGTPSTVFEATGLYFYDALSAVPAAIKDHAAILLTDGSTQAPETAAYLAANPGDTRYTIGGSLAAGGADPTATNISGQGLFNTSAAVARYFFASPSIFGAATAADFPTLGAAGCSWRRGTRGTAPAREPERATATRDHPVSGHSGHRDPGVRAESRIPGGGRVWPSRRGSAQPGPGPPRA